MIRRARNAVHGFFHPKTVIVGKHPLLRQFGRELGHAWGGAIAGAIPGAVVGAALGRPFKTSIADGAMVGGVLGGVGGQLAGDVRSTRKGELLRQKLGIRGAKIKPSTTIAAKLGLTFLTANPVLPLAANPSVRLALRRRSQKHGSIF